MKKKKKGGGVVRKGSSSSSSSTFVVVVVQFGFSKSGRSEEFALTTTDSVRLRGLSSQTTTTTPSMPSCFLLKIKEGIEFFNFFCSEWMVMRFTKKKKTRMVMIVF